MIKKLPPTNTNYNPPRPWQCVTHEAHECEGPVIGAISPVPVCANGAVAEQAARDADRARRDAWLDSAEGRQALRQEAAIERSIEFRH